MTKQRLQQTLAAAIEALRVALAAQGGGAPDTSPK